MDFSITNYNQFAIVKIYRYAKMLIRLLVENFITEKNINIIVKSIA